MWDGKSQAACAQMLMGALAALAALAAGEASPYAVNSVQAAIWVQPVIAALVCLGRGDESGAVRQHGQSGLA